jgi:prepilin-type N-terminal cleavage/methylation domain-containing protein
MASNNDGYTLLELLIVIAIIGTLLAIAAISGSSWLKKTDVESQTKTMYVDILNARASAMQRNRAQFVKLENTRYTVYEDTNPGPDGDGVLQETQDREVMHKDIRAAYSITWNPSADDIIEFSTRGLMSGSQCTVWVQNSYGSAYNCIVVSATRIKMGNFDGTSNCITQ